MFLISFSCAAILVAVLCHNTIRCQLCNKKCYGRGASTYTLVVISADRMSSMLAFSDFLFDYARLFDCGGGNSMLLVDSSHLMQFGTDGYTLRCEQRRLTECLQDIVDNRTATTTIAQLYQVSIRIEYYESYSQCHISVVNGNKYRQSTIYKH